MKSKIIIVALFFIISSHKLFAQFPSMQEFLKMTPTQWDTLFTNNTVNKQAVDFMIKPLEGDSLKLSSLRGKKVVFINFFYIACSPCIREIPVIKELREKYGNKVEFISISVRDSTSQLVNFKSKYAIPYQLMPFQNKVFDIKNRKYTENTMYLARYSYFTNAFPTNIVIDKQGVIKYAKFGANELEIPENRQFFIKAIEDALKE